MSEKKLVRPINDRKLAGVCAGLADYFGIDATIIRILFVLFAVFAAGGILVYIILWLVMPEETAGNVDVVAKNITDDTE